MPAASEEERIDAIEKATERAVTALFREHPEHFSKATDNVAFGLLLRLSDHALVSGLCPEPPKPLAASVITSSSRMEA